MPPIFPRNVKAFFNIVGNGRVPNADLQRLFGTTDYAEAGRIARQQIAQRAQRAERDREAYERRKEYNRQRNRRIREDFRTAFDTRENLSLREMRQRVEGFRQDYRNVFADRDETLAEMRQRMDRLRALQVRRARRSALNILDLYFPLEKLVERVEASGINIDLPLHIVLRSGVMGIEREFDFKNIHHLREWFGKTISYMEVGSTGQSWVVAETVYEPSSNGAYMFQEDVFRVSRIVSIHNIGGGTASAHDREMTIDLPNFTFQVFSPKNQRNNCGFRCLEYLCGELKDTDHNYRKMFGIPAGELVGVTQLLEIYKLQGQHKFLTILDEKSKLTLDFSRCVYVLLHHNHYTVVRSAVSKAEAPSEKKRTKRGWCFWDIETRKAGKDKYCFVGSQRAHFITDAILCARYKDYKSEEWKEKVFVTTAESSSCRQFLDWLIERAWAGKFYNCVAHNGSRFDMFFLIKAFTKDEQLTADMRLRGTSIIGMEFANHQFRDSCCFITDTLERICKSYGVKNGKKTEFDLRGVKLTNKNIWAYKPELFMEDFLKLQETEPDYWEQYVDYCMHDCISLGEVWLRFIQETNGLIEKISPLLLRTCSVQGALTIGSLAKKIVDKLNLKNRHFARLQEFIDNDKEKYDFVCEFKIGGISQCNQPGKHTHGVASVDVTSQYPAAMRYMDVPVGRSSFIYTYQPNAYGFY